MTSETPENRRLTVPDLEAIPVGNVVIDRIADSWVKIPSVLRGPWKWTNPGDPLDTIIATSEELIEDWGPVTAIQPAPLTETVAKDEVPEKTFYTDPQTGGMKEVKLSQLAAIDPTSLWALGEVAGHGADKYEMYNFLKGYPWSLNFNSAQRHLLAFWSGENIDPESYLPHLAHAAWHCLALLSFMNHGLGTDDRWVKPSDD